MHKAHESGLALKVRVLRVLRDFVMSKWSWLAGAALCATLVLFVCGAALRAHELGTTRVSVLFDEGRTYTIDIVTDATGLVEKLDASRGQSRPADLGADRLQPALAGALVDAMNRLNPAEKLSARTDKDGRARFKVRPGGMWLIKAVHMVPAPAGARAEWASFWASLTFEMRNAAVATN